MKVTILTFLVSLLPSSTMGFGICNRHPFPICHRLATRATTSTSTEASTSKELTSIPTLYMTHNNASNNHNNINMNRLKTKEEHIKNQATAFDGMARMFSFCDSLPDDSAFVVNHISIQFLHDIVSQRNDKLQQRRQQQQQQQQQQGSEQDGVTTTNTATNSTANSTRTHYKILDIGCGAGVLLRFLFNEANKLGITLHVVGVDVSEQMIEYGTNHAKNVLRDVNAVGNRNGNGNANGGNVGGHTVEMIADDFIQYLNTKTDDQSPSSTSSSSLGSFDGVIANSCFANFWDMNESIQAMANAICDYGVICVAHPVGSEFVVGLNLYNPYVTPHVMPTETEFEQLIYPYSLEKIDFYETIQYTTTTETLPTATALTTTTTQMTTNTKTKNLPMYYASAVKKCE